MIDCLMMTINMFYSALITLDQYLTHSILLSYAWSIIIQKLASKLGIRLLKSVTYQMFLRLLDMSLFSRISFSWCSNCYNLLQIMFCEAVGGAMGGVSAPYSVSFCNLQLIDFKAKSPFPFQFFHFMSYLVLLLWRETPAFLLQSSFLDTCMHAFVCLYQSYFMFFNYILFKMWLLIMYLMIMCYW